VKAGLPGKKEAAKKNATTVLEEATASVNDAKAFLAKAQKSKVTVPDIDDLAAGVKGLEDSLAEVQKLMAAEDFNAAVQKCDANIVRLLIDRGANPHVGKVAGDTILTNAILSGHADNARLLVSCGAKLKWDADTLVRPDYLPALVEHFSGNQNSGAVVPFCHQRGTTPEEDDRLARDLLADEKERAEHTMLVDLARNDIGRVCKFGTVKVEDFMSIERFSHVQHIVSTVTGVLRDDLDSCDALKSCFPAGTVSGAPKVRAMQIIDELEPIRRGPYTGSIGYLGFSGNADLNIVIRTFVIKNDVAYVQAGAGIVADSSPDKEYFETLKKAEALIKTLERV
jgi:hypothetical protein